MTDAKEKTLGERWVDPAPARPGKPGGPVFCGDCPEVEPAPFTRGLSQCRTHGKVLNEERTDEPKRCNACLGAAQPAPVKGVSHEDLRAQLAEVKAAANDDRVKIGMALGWISDGCELVPSLPDLVEMARINRTKKDKAQATLQRRTALLMKWLGLRISVPLVEQTRAELAGDAPAAQPGDQESVCDREALALRLLNTFRLSPPTRLPKLNLEQAKQQEGEVWNCWLALTADAIAALGTGNAAHDTGTPTVCVARQLWEQVKAERDGARNEAAHAWEAHAKVSKERDELRAKVAELNTEVRDLYQKRAAWRMLAASFLGLDGSDHDDAALRVRLENELKELARLRSQSGPESSDAAVAKAPESPKRRIEPYTVGDALGLKRSCPDCGSLDLDDRDNCNACLERKATEPSQKQAVSAAGIAAHNRGEKGARKLAGPYLDDWWRSEPEKERFSGLRNFAAEIINAIERLQSDVAGKLTVTDSLKDWCRKHINLDGRGSGCMPDDVVHALARAVGEGK